MLDQHQVVKRIITAIRQEEEEVSIPWFVGTLTHLAHGLFPSDAWDKMEDAFVGYKTLMGLTGRAKPKL